MKRFWHVLGQILGMGGVVAGVADTLPNGAVKNTAIIVGAALVAVSSFQKATGLGVPKTP